MLSVSDPVFCSVVKNGAKSVRIFSVDTDTKVTKFWARIRDIVVEVVTALQPRQFEVIIATGTRNFFSETSRLDLEPNQLPTECVPDVCFFFPRR